MDVEERERINTEVTKAFNTYAGKARRVITLSGGALTWLGAGNMTLAFSVYDALFALFWPLVQKIIDSATENGACPRPPYELTLAIRPQFRSVCIILSLPIYHIYTSMSEVFKTHTDGEEAPEVLAYGDLAAGILPDRDYLLNRAAILDAEQATSEKVSRRGLVFGGGATLAATAAAPIIDLVASAALSPAEAAEKRQEVYLAARRLLTTTRTHNGTHDVNIFHAGRLISIGRLNTSVYGGLTRADDIDGVFAEFGFKDAVAFAEQYNSDFPHRTPADKARLIEDAKFVAYARTARREIRVGDPQFMNIRLAAMIWLASENLTRDFSRTFTLGGKTFNTPEVLRVLPGLRGNGLARLLLDHSLTPHVELMMELARRNLRIPDITRPSVPAIAQFIRAVSTVTAGGRVQGGIFKKLSTVYHTLSADEAGYGAGTGTLFIYDQFIASTIGKQYYAFLDFLAGIKLSRNNWNEDVTDTEFARTLEKLPENDPNFVTINEYLPWWGN